MLKDILKLVRSKVAIAIVAFAIFGLFNSERTSEDIRSTIILLAISAAIFVSAAMRIKKDKTTAYFANHQHSVSSQPSEIPAQLQEKAELTHSVEEPNTPYINISVATKTYEIKSYIAEGAEISLLDLDGYESESGGYVNWANYEIIGKNSSTGRQITRRYTAKNRQELEKIANADGITAPYQVNVLPNDLPTERQIEYLRSWNVEPPPGATKRDISAILDRLEGSYDTVYERETAEYEEKYIRPLPSPSAEFAKYADEMGIYFSRFIGAKALFHNVVYSLSELDRAAFFAYCVLCSYHRFDIGNLKASHHAEKLYEFASEAIKIPALANSIAQRTHYDYKSPHKGTKAYKAVAEYFGLK